MALRLIIRTPNHLGDCIMALPMISETREAYPSAHITLLSPDYLSDLFTTNPGIDDFIKIPADYVHGLLAVVKIRELISAGNYDVGYILPPSFGSAAAFKLAGVKERIGYISDGRRLLLSKPLPLPTPLNAEHRSELYFNLLRRSTNRELEYTRPKLFLSDADLQQAEATLKTFGLDPETPYAVIAFQAVAESRRWGTPNYTQLVKTLVSLHHWNVVLIGSGIDHAEGEKITAATGTGPVANLAGKTSIRVSASILAKARVFVGNDSGPAHLAAAVGCPIVVLSGADAPNATSPLSSRKKLIRMDFLDCISCEKNKCPLSGERHMRCMQLITVDMVTGAIAELVDTIASH